MKLTMYWEDDTLVSIEVDGARYKEAEDIPDPEVRDRVLAILERSDESVEDAAFDREFNQESQKGTSGGPDLTRVISTVFMAVAAILLVIAGISAYANWQAAAQEKQAAGKVVEIKEIKDSEGQPFYYPVVQFSLADGTRKTVQLSEGSQPSSYEVGDPVTVYYDPAHLKDAYTSEAGGFRWIVSAITGSLGAIFLIVSVMVHTFASKEEENAR